MPPLKIAFLMNPLEGWDFDGDTSLSIITECHRRGHAIYFLEARDLCLKDTTLWARVRPCAPSRASGLEAAKPVWMNLERLDCLVVRKEPPFDFGYLSCTYLLDYLRGKVFCMNDPAGIRNANEKLSALVSPCRPRSAAGFTEEALSPFIRSLGRRAFVLKRIDEKGGVGILKTHAKDPGLAKKILRLTGNGSRAILVQEFIPHEKTGDKRILLLGSRPIGAFVRYPPKTDFRANMSVGGTAGPGRIDAADRAIIRSLAPFLERNGLYFTGIDILDGRLSEVNVTSPAGIPEVNAFSGGRIENEVADFIERRSGRRRRRRPPERRPPSPARFSA